MYNLFEVDAYKETLTSERLSVPLTLPACFSVCLSVQMEFNHRKIWLSSQSLLRLFERTCLNIGWDTDYFAEDVNVLSKYFQTNIVCRTIR